MYASGQIGNSGTHRKCGQHLASSAAPMVSRERCADLGAIRGMGYGLFGILVFAARCGERLVETEAATKKGGPKTAPRVSTGNRLPSALLFRSPPDDLGSAAGG